MALPPLEQRHRFLRCEGLEYTNLDIADFESRMAMEHRDEDCIVVFTSQAWRRMFSTRGLLVWELILEFLSTLRFGEVLLDLDAPDTIQFQLGGARRRLSWRGFILALGLHTMEEMESPDFARYWSESERMIPGKGDLHDYWRDISTDGDFLGPPPSYTLIRDPVLRLCHRMMAHNIAGRCQAPKKVTVTDLFDLRGLDVRSVNMPYLLTRYLRRFAAGRKSGALISCGQFEGDAGEVVEEAPVAPGGGDEDEEMPQAMPVIVARLAEHFRLLTDEILEGLTVISPELQMIDMAELVRLQICTQFDGYLGMGGYGTREAARAAIAPQQPPPPPPAPARTMPQRMARLEEDVHEIRRALTEQRELDDTWAWVAMRLDRQPDTAAGAPAVAKDAPAVDEGDQAILAPIHTPQQLPPQPPAAARIVPLRLGRLDEDVQGLRRDVGSLHGLVERSMTDQGRFSTWMMTCMTQLMDASGLTYQAFDRTFRGSSPAAFQRRTRQMIVKANTSITQQDPQQPDP
ncbi:hypothetical protein Tco_1021028 [Tanacetum coccineum]